MGLLDRLAAPFKGLMEWQKQQAAAAAEKARRETELLQSRRQAYLNEVMEEFKEAEQIRPKPYRDLSPGETRMGKIAAVEYLHASASIRIHNLMSQETMRLAALIDALGMRTDELEEGEIGEIIDVKPKDQASIEHGALILGPVPEWENAVGTHWRFFLELSYSGAAGSARGGIQTKRFIADCTV